ncbi:hypothetical protein RPATATE_0645 [Rickettsia parkeri str. Tate's Hell]|uniref:Uncharacterized protein n=1 Tax=Rickettsia parkeri str. Tate's Hell TaxID=1359189 RepID=A0ABR5DPQ8_RICPA|nr:hypothetical protein RPAAT24_0277 [Rickettsia parkeri str. AT\
MGHIYYVKNVLPSLRGNCIAIDEAISRVCYYFMRLPRSIRLLAMTEQE